MPRINSYSPGFTLAELTVVIVMVPIIITLFIFALYEISNSSSRQSTKLALSDNMQLAIDTIESDIKLSTTFTETLPAGFSDPYGIDNTGTAWNFAGTSATSRVLLLSNIATTQNRSTDIRTPVYTDEATYNCTNEMELNALHTYTIVYFVRSQKLYRRVITNTATPLCNGPDSQKQSCPPELSGSWNVICEARDEVIASDVSTFSIDYYTLRDTTPMTTIYSSPDPEDMDVIDDAEITLGLSRGAGTSTVTTSQTLRIARLNQP